MENHEARLDFRGDHPEGEGAANDLAHVHGLTARKLIESLQQRYEADGFAVLAFPCNQFGGQEPGTSEEILEFVAKYGVTFPIFDKIDVNGPNTHPLYKFLKEQKSEPGVAGFLGNDIKWNFAKYG